MNRFAGCVALLFLLHGGPAFAGGAETISIIPRPREVRSFEGVFELKDCPAVVACGDEISGIARYLADRLADETGLKLPVETGNRPYSGAAIVLELCDDIAGAEDYELRATAEGVTLRALRPAGLFRGVQTLRQLLGPRADGSAPAVPCVSIRDGPRFRWRGSLLDSSRHFLTKDFVKRYIDILAYHKMNVLHWHLCDDQGWRVQIEKYPELTSVGAWAGRGRNRHGGFYSQEDIRDIVSYAADRYITIVPEIEMPGHCTAALAAYPQLSCTGGPFEVSTVTGVHKDVYCAGSEKVFAFLEGVLEEICDLFPSRYIHIGADECPTDRWRDCNRCRRRIEQAGLDGPEGLHGYFVNRVAAFLRGRNRRLIGWDEILRPGLPTQAVIQSWRGMEPAAAALAAGYDVIVSPRGYCYLDYTHEVTGLEKAYSFEPVPLLPAGSTAGRVLGGEANMWTDHAAQELVESFAFPRLCALGEVFWSLRRLRDWEDFSRRMQAHYRRLDRMNVSYYRDVPTARLALLGPSSIGTRRRSSCWGIDDFLEEAGRPDRIFAVFVYDKGADGVVISGVELLEDGLPVESIMREQFCGWANVYNSYGLSTTSLRKGCRYELRAAFRGDGAADAWMSVWVSTDALPPDLY